MTGVIILILIGLFLFVVEFLLVPGITIAGIGGVLSLVGGIIWAYTGYGNTVGHITLISTLALTFFTIAVALRSNTWKRFMLNTNVDASVASASPSELVSVGDVGITISRLTPMGKARFNNVVHEVQSTGSYIDQKTEIIALRIEGTKIIVKPKIS